MKLREFKQLVDRAVETARDYEDHNVVIAVKLPYTTVGARPTVPVISAFKGFELGEWSVYYYTRRKSHTC